MNAGAATKTKRGGGAVGRRGEQIAQAFLERAGYRVVDVNVRQAGKNADGLPGEIDIVAWDDSGAAANSGGAALCFVEVKTRRARTYQDARHSAPAEAVDQNKQRRIARLAWAYAARYGLLSESDIASDTETSAPSPVTLRFDVVAVTLIAGASGDHADGWAYLPPRLIKGAFLAPDGWAD